ncbi:MAG TPA: hypothetical protein DIU07_12920 [Rhodobacteraceae bacterium]|nr:hypothetical protein [Paracoccaceae bacterium]
MFSDLFQISLAAATLASGLVAGVFLTFSDFVMRSLGRAGPAAGIKAMQMINREVYRSLFMVLLMGMAVVSAVLAFAGVVFIGGAAAGWLTAAAVAYLAGVMAVTARANVPMNQRLDREYPDSDPARAVWKTYQRDWTRWNHLRTVASGGAMLCFFAASLTFAAG